MLRIPRDEIGLIEVLDQELPSDRFRGKFCRLDMRVRIGGRIREYRASDKEPAGLPRTDAVLLVEDVLGYPARERRVTVGRGSASASIFSGSICSTLRIYSEFGVYEKKRHEMLSDKLKIYFFEMGKLRNGFDPGDPRELWLKFIDSESEEELQNDRKEHDHAGDEKSDDGDTSYVRGRKRGATTNGSRSR